jgi:hypothetical protein
MIFLAGVISPLSSFVITMLGCHQSTDHGSARDLLVDGPPDGNP